MSEAGLPEDVCVVVPAHDAEATVGRAVASALGEPEVAEVLVVDDASRDDTAGAARAADDGTGRLTVVRLDANAGPAAARNVAIARSRSPLIALLDADDAFAPGRLGRLLAEDDWDLIADDIRFVQSETALAAAAEQAAPPGQTRRLSLAEFAASNIVVPGRPRRELGFLHPVMRRRALDAHGLRYDPALRLGEDYDLYARALAAGLRFRLSDSVGYLALERPGSLSGAHRTEDLARLAAVDGRLLAQRGLTPAERRAIARHRADVERRHALRHFLDAKRAGGLRAGLAVLLADPRRAPAVVAGVARDKRAALARHLGATRRRPETLLPTR